MAVLVSFSCLLESAYLCLCHNAIITPSFFAVALVCPSLSLACAEEKKNDSFRLIRLVRIILFDFMDWLANVACLGRGMIVFVFFIFYGRVIFLFFIFYGREGSLFPPLQCFVFCN